CEGKGPFRWAALSGEASDIAKAAGLLADDGQQGRPTTRRRESTRSAPSAHAGLWRTCPG
ncbi:hypothetical protein ABZ281_50395, partial [Streptomyces sp. NPDC006265]|uniref:hypothetical protein n=1 Tax=Streptomyces sp. NPDC006265 TaxID=3156740 RepID=UPI0033B2CD54